MLWFGVGLVGFLHIESPFNLTASAHAASTLVGGLCFR